MAKTTQADIETYIFMMNRQEKNMSAAPTKELVVLDQKEYRFDSRLEFEKAWVRHNACRDKEEAETMLSVKLSNGGAIVYMSSHVQTAWEGWQQREHFESHGEGFGCVSFVDTHPVYYVMRPDGSYAVADPQPVQKV